MRKKPKSLKTYLEENKIKEVDFARLIGTSQPYVNQLRNGRRRPSPAIAAKIEEATGIPLRDLLLMPE